MKVLVTGGTGKVGTEVVNALLSRGASVRVLTRNKEAKLPVGAEVAVGDLLDPDSVRSALNGVDKLFLLIGNVADELTQALLTVAVARGYTGKTSLLSKTDSSKLEKWEGAGTEPVVNFSTSA